jgi:hypothetical protein
MPQSFIELRRFNRSSTALLHPRQRTQEAQLEE